MSTRWWPYVANDATPAADLKTIHRNFTEVYSKGGARFPARRVRTTGAI